MTITYTYGEHRGEAETVASFSWLHPGAPEIKNEITLEMDRAGAAALDAWLDVADREAVAREVYIAMRLASK